MLKIISKAHFVNNKYFYLILIVGFLLRVIGINYGYPYIFNIDEPTIVRSTLGLRYTPEIGHFDWPHFTFYFNYVFYFIFIKARGLAQVLGMREMIEGLFPILWNDPFIFYFITRFVNALFGSLTVVPVYLMAKSMFSKRVGLLSAVLFSFTPYLIYISHVATPDSLLTFFITWGIYFTYRFSVSLGYKDILLSGVAFGLASSIKYNAILLSIVLPLFVYFSLKNSNRSNMNLMKNVFVKFVLFGLVSLLALLATTPEIITDWDLFWSYEYGKGFLWQLTVNSGPLSWSDYLPAVVEQSRKIFFDMGVIIPILFIIGIYKSIKNEGNTSEKSLNLIMAAITILFILFTSRYSRATSHYFISVYPTLIIVAAWTLDKLKPQMITRVAVVILFVLSAYNTALFLRQDTRHEALQYYEASREQGGRTYFEGNDLSEADLVNNLNMKRARNGFDLAENDILLTQTPMQNDDKIVHIETIGNFFRKGPIIYVYKKAI